jgi:hypothetical protein
MGSLEALSGYLLRKIRATENLYEISMPGFGAGDILSQVRLPSGSNGRVPASRFPAGDVRIMLQADGFRFLGALRLPQILVEMDLQALSEEAATNFLARFDRAFQRGGG